MRLLLDVNLSPRVAEALRAAGFDATHVDDELLTASDDEIFDWAAGHDHVVVAPTRPVESP